MISVLGFNLDHAVSVLESEGYTVTGIEYSSKKGVKGNERRVIRQRLIEEPNTVELVYSVFKTDVDYNYE